eukprot:3306541-Heterocapsa_arctica.AAC.1
MGLEYVDADVRAAGRLLLADREGRAHALRQWLSLPMWRGYSDESSTLCGSGRAHAWRQWLSLPMRPGCGGAASCRGAAASCRGDAFLELS